MSASRSSSAVGRTYLQRRAFLKQRFEKDFDARAYLEEHAGAVDTLIRELIDGSDRKPDFAAFATGGYGRRELYPASDIDLIFVYPQSSAALAETNIKELLHTLWDCRLDLGHQVWPLEDLANIDLNRPDLLLALLDVRLLAGNEEIAGQMLENILPHHLTGLREDLTQIIAALVSERHNSYAGTIYQLEPDVKQSPGGLRDLLAARWLERLHDSQTFLPYMRSEMIEAEEFLAGIRILLHLISGRNQNQLTHRRQVDVVGRLSAFWRAADLRGRTEELMQAYFLNARRIFGYCRSQLRRHDNEQRVVFSDTELAQLRDSDSTGLLRAILQLFRRAVDEGKDAGDSALEIVSDALTLLKTVRFPELRDDLQALFNPGPGLYRVLSQMYEVGVLEYLFPELKGIKARVIRDFYHQYTVDEHTLLAVGAIEQLRCGSAVERDPRFEGLLEDVQSPVLLTLALLLHDVGKCEDSNHTQRSLRLARQALERYEFSESARQMVEFLIEHHLVMSDLMTRQDLNDPGVVARFADWINDVEKLKLLTLLTYADIKAVAPNTLNRWKRDLLWQAYLQTYRELTVAYGSRRIGREQLGKDLIDAVPQGLNRARFQKFLDGFPTRYLLTVSPEAIYQQFELAGNLSPDAPLQAKLVERSTHHELWVVTPDQARLFSRIVGLLAYFEMNIFRGYGFSNRAGTVLDFFHFTDLKGLFSGDAGEKAKFLRLLQQAVRGRLSVARLLARKAESVVFQPRIPWFRPTIHFEDSRGEDYTVMELVAADEPGLLYKVTHVMASLECDIDLALISTEGEKAVDVFYLKHSGGRLDEQVSSRLKQRLLEAFPVEESE